jgi:rod shape-determining protein MreD
VRTLISFVIVAVMVVVQLTVVDRIAFPGGSGPDLVLVVVAGLALASGPLTGALIGFWAGLALDVAPPGSHFTGQDALVFCLIGYACGLLADDSAGDTMTEPGHTALFEIVVTAAGAVCGEALVALLGVMLSDPRVTWPAITHVLPVAVAYDVLLCPFVLYAAAAAWRLAGAGRGAARSPSRVAVPGPGAARRPAARREPRLKLGRAAPGSTRTAGHGNLGAAFASGGSPRVKFGSRQGVLGGSLLGGSVFSRTAPPGLPSRGSTFARSASLGGSSPLGRSSPFGRSSPLRHRNPFKHTSNFRLVSTRGQLKSPGRGWLRASSPSRGLARGGGLPRGGGLARNRGLGRNRSLARGFRSGRGLTSARGYRPLGPARLHMPRPGRSKARRRWRPSRWGTGGYL